jgi:ubiquinone/menaquinone biosynthesis C-methylase UbiE
LGYSEKDLAISGNAKMLGCGVPCQLANLQAGETVIDLGSGSGADCFLAAEGVGSTGTVIGVDMTPEMLATARAAARERKASNVSFRLGEIEHLPVADNTADVVISNCVINLSPDKKQVFSEVFRVLKQGGRIAISDIVATQVLPQALRTAEALVC